MAPASRRATKAVIKSVKDVGVEVERPAVVGDEVGAAEEAEDDGFGAADEAEDDGFGAADVAEDDGFGCSCDFFGRRMNRAQDSDVVLGASVVEGRVDKSEVCMVRFDDE